MPPNDDPRGRLRSLLAAAVARPDRADLAAIAAAAGAVFAALERTDMRRGIATIVGRSAAIASDRARPLPGEVWSALAGAADLLDEPKLAPSAIRRLDEQLRALGLDVDPAPGPAGGPANDESSARERNG